MIAFRLVDAYHRGELATAVKKSTSGVMSEVYIARYRHIERVVVSMAESVGHVAWRI